MHLRVINSFTWIFHQIEINVYTESAKIWSQTHNTLHRSHMKPCEFIDLDLYSAPCYRTLANSLICHSPIIWQKFSRSSICKRRCHWWLFILCLKPEFMGLKFKIVLWHMVGLHVCSLFWDVVSLHSPVFTKCVLHSLEKQNCVCKTKENSTFHTQIFPNMLDIVVLWGTIFSATSEIHSLSDSMRRVLARWQIHSELSNFFLIFSDL